MTICETTTQAPKTLPSNSIRPPETASSSDSEISDRDFCISSAEMLKPSSRAMEITVSASSALLNFSIVDLSDLAFSRKALSCSDDIRLIVGVLLLSSSRCFVVICLVENFVKKCGAIGGGDIELVHRPVSPSRATVNGRGRSPARHPLCGCTDLLASMSRSTCRLLGGPT